MIVVKPLPSTSSGPAAAIDLDRNEALARCFVSWGSNTSKYHFKGSSHFAGKPKIRELHKALYFMNGGWGEIYSIFPLGLGAQTWKMVGSC